MKDDKILVFVDSEDEITTLIDKISDQEEEQIYVLVPARISLMHSLVNLKLLKEQTENRGKKIVIVTPDKIIREVAKKAGLPVLKKIEEKESKSGDDNKSFLKEENWWGKIPSAKTKPPYYPTKQNFHLENIDDDDSELQEDKKNIEKVPKKEKRKENKLPSSKEDNEEIERENKEEIGKADSSEKVQFEEIEISKWDFQKSMQSGLKRIRNFFMGIGKFLRDFLFLLGQGSWIWVLAVLFILIFFLFVPRVQVDISLPLRSFESDFTVQALDQVTDVNFTLRQIPADYLELEREGEKKVPVTGEMLKGAPARGLVAIKNKADQKVLPAGTILTAPGGEKFKLVKETVVPAAWVDSFGITRLNENPNVMVAAVQDGEEGNIKATDFSIAGLDASLTWAESYKPFSGGYSRKVKVVTEEDKEKLESGLYAELLEEGRYEMKKVKGEEQKIPVDSIESEVLLQEFSHEVGEEAQNLSLKMKIRMKAIAFSGEDLDNVLERGFKSLIPGGYKILEEDMRMWHELDRVEMPLKGLIFKGHVEGYLMPDIQWEEIKSKLKMKTENQAEEIILEALAERYSSLDQNKPINKPEISFRPNWLKFFPFLKSRIKLNLHSQEKSENLEEQI